MSIVNHKLSYAKWVPTVHKYRKIKPTVAIVHESGTPIAKGRAVQYCRRNKRKVAYHVLIERDGTIVQMAEFNRKLNHAGKSSYKGRKWCNGFSVGVALVGPTQLKGDLNSAVSYYDKTFTAADGLTDKGSKYHGYNHIWLKYTPAQLVSLDKVLADLVDEYGLAISSHYEVSPGRKIDPSPELDMSVVGTIKEVPELHHESDVFVGEPEVVEKKNIEKFKKTSRKMRFTSRMKKFILGAVPVGFFSWETFGEVKQFVTDNAGIMLLVLGVAAYLVFKYFEVKQEEDYVEGRYIPSEYDIKETPNGE